MAIRNVKTSKDPLFRVFCDKCGKHSNCSHVDPGDLAIKSKKEAWKTVLASDPTEPMLWNCSSCSNIESNGTVA